MSILTTATPGLLFSDTVLDYWLVEYREKIASMVEHMEANQLLNTAPEDLVRYLVESARVEPIHLRLEEWSVDVNDAMVGVRSDTRRNMRNARRSAPAPGELVEVHVPFDGPDHFFFAKPSQWTSNPPRGQVVNGELVLSFEYPADSAHDARADIDRMLADIELYLDCQRDQISEYNAALDQVARQAVSDRRERLLAKARRTVALGIPVRQRADATNTYAVPDVRRKATPTLPPASSTPYEPEPAWAMEHYEHALNVVQNMSVLMERSPSAFKTMTEEDIRQAFLMQLNGQFEGKATGETFNKSGKTDILLREGERNVFIAECKFWKGPKGFAEAVDQLLSYTTWRDSKTAILVFNKEVAMDRVLAGVDETAQAHPNFKRSVGFPHESGFRYVFHQPGDSNRELMLTVLVFHVPS